MSELAGTTVWIPRVARPDTEWAEFYRFLGDDFAIGFDTSGPVFGNEHLAERVGSDGLVTFTGKRTRLPLARRRHPDPAHRARSRVRAARRLTRGGLGR